MPSSDCQLDDDPALLQLFEYWNLFCRAKRRIVAGAFIGLLLAIGFSLLENRSYEIRTALEIEDLNQDYLNLKHLQATSAVQTSTNESYMETQLQLLQSESLLRSVINSLDLEHRLSFRSPLIADLQRTLHLAQAADQPRDKFVRAVQKRLSMRVPRQSRIVEIRFDAPNPKIAAEFLNALTAAFINRTLETRWKSSENTRAWINGQLEELKNRLERSDDRLQQYARSSGLVFVSNQSNISQQKLEQLQQELSRAQADRMAKQSQFQLVNTASLDSLPQVLDDESVRDLHDKLNNARAQLTNLRAAFTPEHHSVRRTQAEVTELQSSLEKYRANIARRIRNEYEAADEREQLVATAFAAQQRRVADLALARVRYDTLKREVDANMQLYQAMLDQGREAGVAAGMRPTNVTVIDPALPPSNPVRPKLVLNCLAGAGAGFFLSLLSLIVHDRLNRAIRHPGETTLYLSIPELAVVPTIEMERRRRGLHRSRGRDRYPSKALIGLHLSRPGCSNPTLRGAAVRESFRSAVDSILAMNSGRSYVVMIASAGSGEGKTTVACNLAIALASAKRNVLLVDADTRRPQVHNVFGVRNSQGFSKAMESRDDAGEDLQPLISSTHIMGLDLITAGDYSEGVVTGLYSHCISNFLTTAKSRYDVVIVDTPPALQFFEARPLGRLSDGVIFVVRAGVTHRDMMIEAVARFAADRIAILGTILNDFDSKHASAYSRYYADRRVDGLTASRAHS